MRLRFLTAVAATLAAVLLALPAAGAAAERRTPFGFFGTVLPNQLSDPSVVSADALDAQMALMAASGVESVRLPLTWAGAEPAPGRYDWTRSDRVVAAAARHRIGVLVNVMLTPAWASSRPGAENPSIWPPTKSSLFGRFMTRLVRRYGPKGSFWAHHADLPRTPVRRWQIWNEQMAPWMWGPRPWPKSYVRLLKAAYRAVHAADRGAQVVAGSVVAYARQTQWKAVGGMYRAGAKGFFDAIAVHPFTTDPFSVRRTIDNTVLILKRVRTQMRARRQGPLPLYVTELTYPASLGLIPPDRYLGLETTPAGQAERLEAAYTRLARLRRKLRIAQVHWYSWATEYDADSPNSDVTFRFAGLNRVQNGVFSPMPLLNVYASVAARYQGCAKSTNARVCR